METIIQDFINKYKEAALVVEEQTGISHLFILAQAALESGWGQHAPRNMFFGVKASRCCRAVPCHYQCATSP